MALADDTLAGGAPVQVTGHGAAGDANHDALQLDTYG